MDEKSYVISQGDTLVISFSGDNIPSASDFFVALGTRPGKIVYAQLMSTGALTWTINGTTGTVEIPSGVTSTLSSGSYSYNVQALYNDGSVETVAHGWVTIMSPGMPAVPVEGSPSPQSLYFLTPDEKSALDLVLANAFAPANHTHGDGYSPAAPQYHASQHASGGADPISPEDIGAAPAQHGAQHSAGGSDPITISLSQIAQDGAVDQQVPVWNAATGKWEPGNIEANPGPHASTHATGGSDPITPAMIGAASQIDFDTHASDTNNPHNVTASQIGAAQAQHASQHASGGSDPVTIAPSQISPQGAGSGLDADTLRGKAPDGLWTSGDASTSVDWNSVVTAGLYDLLLHGSENPNGPGVSAYFHVLVARYANVIERLLQLALPTASNGGALESIFYRGYNQQAGTWTNWREIFDTYNTAVGSNANGWYVRFPNGLQICWVVGIGMTYNMAKTWTYPAAFVAAPAVAGLGYRGRLEVHGSVSATSAELRNYDSGTSGGTHAYLIAIGRWK